MKKVLKFCMKTFVGIFFVGYIAVLFVGCASQEKVEKELTVSAAASLTELMREIKPAFEEKYGTKLITNLASSGTLQRQIEEGAPVDIFISASISKMDTLSSKGLIDEESREELLKNSLVLIVSDESKEKIKSLEDLKKDNIKVSIGEPRSVPAGMYGKESLEYYNIYKDIEGKLIFAKNVKQVLSYVESSEVDAGVVYQSDATLLKNSVVAKQLDKKSHRPIVYPGAVIKNSKNKEIAGEFIEFFKSDEVKILIKNYGFEI